MFAWNGKENEESMKQTFVTAKFAVFRQKHQNKLIFEISRLVWTF